VSGRIGDVTTAQVVDMDAAKRLFLWAQKCCSDAARYFTLEDKCSDYVELIRFHIFV
jgi:KIF-1 binding protein C terminal